MKHVAYFLTLILALFSSFWDSTATWRPEPETFIEFDETEAYTKENYKIDASHASDGVVSISAVSDSQLRLLVEKDGQETRYAIPADGTPVTISLVFGDGTYVLSVMEQIEGITYRRAWTCEVNVELKDELAPYLHPNIYVPYAPTSVCTQKAEELMQFSVSQTAFLENVELYVEKNVAYNYDFVPGSLYSHTIDPDGTLSAGKGICLDQAALVASMLRSQGIPAKLCFGNVHYEEKTRYHAWVCGWDGTSWLLLDACMPADIQNALEYEITEWF